MEMEGATIEINGVTTEIYAEEMGVEYGDEDKEEESSATTNSGPVTIYRLVKREDAEAMGISLVEGSVSTPNHNLKVITRHLIKLKNKPKNMVIAQKGVSQYLKMENDDELEGTIVSPLRGKLSRYHRKANSYMCELCTKSFKHASHLKRHINTHTAERLYGCDDCGKEFLDASTLTRHRRTHTGDKPYRCVVCDKCFNTVGSLRRHATCHDPSSRPYVCDTCEKRFPDKSSFQKHLMIHTGIKDHVCEVCEKAFVHIGDLNGHKKIHDAVKQYRCTRCHRDFSKYSNYARHVLIHEGNKAFVCHICFVGYNFQSSLTRHLLTHVKKDASKVRSVKVLIVPEKDDKLTLRHIRELVRGQEEEWLEYDEADEGIEYVEESYVEDAREEGFRVVDIGQVFEEEVVDGGHVTTEVSEEYEDISASNVKHELGSLEAEGDGNGHASETENSDRQVACDADSGFVRIIYNEEPNEHAVETQN